jgi:glycosyltransferase involved in cell wall biosynthesis
MNRPLPALALLIRDLGFGGAQRQLVTLARALHGSSFAVTVVSFYPGPLAADLTAAGVPQITIGKHSRWDLVGFSLRLAQTLRRLQPAVLHGYLAESNLMALLLKPFCGHPKIVWGVRDSESDAHQWGLLGRASFHLNCLLSRFANQIIANSQSGRRWYQTQGFPSEAARFAVVPNGIDIERFQPRPGLAPATPLLGIIGRLNPMKDHPTFLRAAALVARQHPDVRFEVIGDGPEHALKELQHLARDLGLASCVTWCPGQSDPETVYPRLTAIVSSSAYGEGFSNVLAEAMACGIPGIATDVGDAAIVLGDTGFLCPPRNPAALAEAMTRFLDLPPAARASLGQQARQRIATHFTIPQMIQRTAALLHPTLPLPAKA